MGTLWPWRDAHGQQQYSNRLWHSSDDWLVLILDGWRKAGRVHGFMLLLPYHLYASAEIEIHQTRRPFSSLQLSSCPACVPLQPQLWVLGWQKLNPTWCFCRCSPSTPIGPFPADPSLQEGISIRRTASRCMLFVFRTILFFSQFGSKSHPHFSNYPVLLAFRFTA